MSISAEQTIQQNTYELEKYITKYYSLKKESDVNTMADIIIMAIVRSGVEFRRLLHDMKKGILDIAEFNSTKNGNIYDFIPPKYQYIAVRCLEIKVGSNGGMANIGKGEWLISLLSGIDPTTNTPCAKMIKNGRGDIQFKKKNWEIKFNGGKICCDQTPGTEVQNRFIALLKDEGIPINKDDPLAKWVPFRVTDKYSDEKKNRYNAKYYQAITKEEHDSLTDNELKKLFIDQAYKNCFNKSDTIIIFNKNGDFIRFDNIHEANEYYADKLHLLRGNNGFEIRAKQKNPPSLYCHVFN